MDSSEMKAARLETLAQELRTQLEKVEVRVRIARHAVSTREGSSVDAPEVSCEEDVDLAIIQSQSQAAKAIRGALTRLRLGTYGRCSTCGTNIGEARLRALPFATACKACQEQIDRTRRFSTTGDRRRDAKVLSHFLTALEDSPIDPHVEP
jgi:RNA polymerase-binding transcription factor DksA